MYKKAVIHGCYNTTNFGDLLLLEIIAKYLKEKWLIESVTLRLPSAIQLEYCDAEWKVGNVLFPKFVVFGGGGYLEDDNGTKIGKKVLLRYTLPARLWRLFGISYALVGAGAGPIGSKTGGKRIKYICQHATFLSIRDDVSANLLKKVGVNRIIDITADLALTLNDSDIPDTHRYSMHDLKAKIGHEKKILGFHLEKIYDDQDRFKAFCALNFFKDNVFLKKFHIIFFYDYSSQNVSWVGQQLSKIENLSYCIQPRMNHWTTADFLRQCDAILTTKLHVSIVSATFGVPVFGFSFHEKSARFFQQIGRGNYQKMWDGDMNCIDDWMEGLKDENDKAWYLNDDLIKEIKSLASNNFELLDNYIKSKL
ncbi:polysaccharide pyruvyl transferase family protein [Olivibacter sitiensis]|uniref:polysaccharide pyruvyl transferase family protein n=1 Tax=Olivibacter sitiensis TaxID=376470 RepID=UPI00041ABF5A|nr:polysaccharide pyruvyl transferase family protein [Olivibacter sitiensis]